MDRNLCTLENENMVAQSNDSDHTESARPDTEYGVWMEQSSEYRLRDTELGLTGIAKIDLV